MIVQGGQRGELLLARRVPDFELQGSSLDMQGLGEECSAYRWERILYEISPDKS